MQTLRRWWWIPLVALVGIFLKALLLTPWVAGKAEDAALVALAEQDLSAVEFVQVEGVSGLGGDGLNVVLEGPLADEQAAVAAVAAREEINRVSYIPTVGDAPASEDEPLTDDEVVIDDEPMVEDPAPEEELAPAAPATLEPAALALAATGDTIVLSGTVGDEAARDNILAEARSLYGEANVTDELIVDGGRGAEGGVLTLSGEARSDSERSQWLERGNAVAAIAGLEVVDEITVSSMDNQLNDLFALDPVEFDYFRSAIRKSSIPTLEAAAKLLNDNPDVSGLRIVGHTDSDGTDAQNQRLSEARATAVKNYLVEIGGVDASRLEIEGRGESELLVSPELTLADKQSNRRIEWELNQ